MSDMYLGSQLPIYQNVRIRVFNKNTGQVKTERNIKNRVTRLMLWGIARFLSGEFNDSTPDKIYEYIPRFLALGSNQPSSNDSYSGVTTAVTVNDTRLLNEHTVASSTGRSEPCRRINIQGRQHSKTSTAFSDSFVKLSLSTYISSSAYNDLQIGEAGLFSKEKDNNCLARVVFTPFTKTEEEVIDIQWDITLLSYGITKYPESVSIEGPNIIKVPLSFTPYKIITSDSGLYYDKEGSVIYAKVGDSDENIFFIDEFNCLNEIDPANSMMTYVNSNARESSYVMQKIADKETILDRKLNEDEITAITDSCLADVYRSLIGTMIYNNHLYSCLKTLDVGTAKNEEHLTGAEPDSPTIYHLGEAVRVTGRDNLLADVDGNLILDKDSNNIATADPVSGTSFAQSIQVSEIYHEDIIYAYQPMPYFIKSREGYDNLFIVDADNKDTEYIVSDNEVYKIDENKDGGVTPLNIYLTTQQILSESDLQGYLIVDQDGRETGYLYTDEGQIVKKIDEDKVYRISTDAFLVWNDDKFSTRCIYEYDDYRHIRNTGFIINWSTDKEVFTSLGEDTMYHVTTSGVDRNHNYFAIGDTYALIASIQPSDTTDRSLSWSVVNSQISKINVQGVLHAWNVGETLAYVTTSNNIKARTTIEVIRDTELVHAQDINVSPQIITFNVTTEANQYKVVTASVVPPYATFNNVAWTLDADAEKLVIFESLGDNSARIKLNGSGNVGRGHIIATTGDGLTARCLIQISTNTDNDMDCDDESHVVE